MRATTEASIGSVKLIYASNCVDCSIVVSGVVKYKVTQLITGNAVYPKRLDNCLGNSLARMGASKLWQVDRQVLYYSRGVS
jgi:hypothetical protein